MKTPDPIETLAASLYSALLIDLSPIMTPKYQSFQDKKENKEPELVKIRPRIDQVEVVHFPQSWPSTALGFDIPGGSMFVSAYTTVVSYNTESAIYFGGVFAYLVKNPSIKFVDDLQKHNLASVKDSQNLYNL